MILPATDVLVAHYPPDQVEVLEKARFLIQNKSERDQRAQMRRVIDRLWPTESDRIQNTHWFTTKEGGIAPFRWNRAQRALYRIFQDLDAAREPIRIVIVKARQMGISLFLQSLFYDRVARSAGTSSVTINYDTDVTAELFRKAKLIHDQNWGALDTRRSSTMTIEFAAPHHGKFHTKTAGSVGSGRSLTAQLVHCSEPPLWADMERTMMGITSVVPLKRGTAIVVESTAAGAFGPFYDMWNAAVDRTSRFVPFFAPWFWDDGYFLPFADQAQEQHFARMMPDRDRRLMQRFGLTLPQMHWRRYKIDTEFAGVEARFHQENPCTADEAFLTSGSPVFDQEWLADMRASAREPLWTGDFVLTN